MPKAVVGSGVNIIVGADQRKCRVGVYKDVFDDVVAKLEKTNVPTEMVVDGLKVEVDGVKHRVDVKVPLFDRAVEKLEKV